MAIRWQRSAEGVGWQGVSGGAGLKEPRVLVTTGRMAIGLPGCQWSLCYLDKPRIDESSVGLLRSIGEGCVCNYLHGIEGLILLVCWANPFLLGIAFQRTARV